MVEEITLDDLESIVDGKDSLSDYTLKAFLKKVNSLIKQANASIEEINTNIDQMQAEIDDIKDQLQRGA